MAKTINSASGADIKLVFGASEASYGAISKDLADIISRIEKDGIPSIKISLDYKESDVKRLESDLKKITDNISKTFSNIGLPQISTITSGRSTAASGSNVISDGLSASNISKVEQSLQSIKGMSSDVISKIAQSVSDANVQILSVETSFKRVKNEADKLLQLNISGKNELGQSVKYLATYDSAGKEIAKELVKIKTQWKDVGEATKQATQNVSDSPAKTLGDGYQSARKNLNSLIADARLLQQKTVGSTAQINMQSLLGFEKSDLGTLPISEAANEIVKSLQSLGNISADTSVEEFNQVFGIATTNFQKLSKEARIAAQETKNYQRAERESLQDSNALSKAIVSTNRAYKQATESVQKYTAAKNGKSSREYAELERTAEALRLVGERLNNGTISEKEYLAETNRLRASVQRTTAIIKANGEAHLSLGDKVKVAAAKFTEYFGIAKIVQRAWQMSQKMLQATIELDDAFTQLKIVTGATDEEMAKFSDRAINLAKSLGQSVASVTGSIETFSRLGYNLDESSTLAQYATILANTASVSVDEATTGLTSIIKGFGMDVSNAEHVADVLIKVGQEYAVSAGEMMEAYERSGAALNATNTSFEKSAGLIAAANASVQDSSVVGRIVPSITAM